MKKFFCIFFIFLYCLIQVGQAAAVKGVNGVYLDTERPKSNFSFLVMGHIYGDPSTPPPVWCRSYFSPAVTLVKNMDWITELEVDFVISLGDMLGSAWFIEERHMLDALVLKKFNVPIFNAVGNHDLSRNPDDPENLYEINYGPRSFYFRYSNSMFIFPDSNDLDVPLFLEAIGVVEADPDIRRIFVCMHHPKFLAADPKFAVVDRHTNRSRIWNKSTKFMKHCYPELEELSKDRDIYLMAGDFGVDWSFSVFYQKWNNMHFIGTGIGDYEHDAILKFDCSESGVRITPISLMPGKKMHSIERYGVDFWRVYFSPLGKIYRKVIIKNFKYVAAGGVAGFLSCILLGIFLWGSIALFKRKKNRCAE